MIFGTLISLVPVATRWLMNNSAAIGDAFKAIKNVAGRFKKSSEDENEIIFIAHPETADTIPSTTNIQDALAKANKTLSKEAEVPIPGGQGKHPNDSKLNAIWVDPSDAVDQVPSQTMYRELAQHLNEENYPLSFPLGNNKTGDLPYLLASVVLDNKSKQSNRSVSQLNDETRLITQKFDTASENDEFKFKARFVHYDLPLGKGGEDNAWHIALHAASRSTDKLMAQHERKKQSFFWTSDKKPPPGAVWILTCEIDWKAVLMAENSHNKVEEALLQKPGYYVALSNLDATIQTLKLVISGNEQPAQARAYLELKAAEISKNTKDNSMHLLDERTEPLMRQSPTVDLTNYSFRANYQDTSDYYMAYNRYLEAQKLTKPGSESMQEAEMIDFKDCADAISEIKTGV